MRRLLKRQFKVIEGGRILSLPAPRIPLPADWQTTVELCFSTSYFVTWHDAAFLLSLGSEETLTPWQRDRLARLWQKVAANSHHYASDDGDAA